MANDQQEDDSPVFPEQGWVRSVVVAYLEDKFDTEGPLPCAGCGCDLRQKDPHSDIAMCENLVCCYSCMGAMMESWVEGAKEYAQANCKLTGTLPDYDESQEFRCSPEDYEMGDKVSYSPNSYFAFCRHNRTNYDQLIKPLSKDDLKDRVYYRAIYTRICELLSAESDTIDEMVDLGYLNWVNDSGQLY